MTDGCHAQAAPIAAHDCSFASVADASVLLIFPQHTPRGDGAAGRIDRVEGPPTTLRDFMQLNRKHSMYGRWKVHQVNFPSGGMTLGQCRLALAVHERRSC